ncbi:putative S-protein [Cardamine amara subsp. amara]|uniref:S-protein homolog n=1 Tax=Cardamine amara subsp. amara TaxID=228776 RepID=A0ABD1AMP9_CARAN
MAFSNKPHYILMFMTSSILVLFATALDVSNAATEAPSPGSGGDGFLPLAKKHVVIRNALANKQPLNVHCKSSEDDLGMVEIPWGLTWDFRFKVNWKKTTKFGCLFTWYGGGDHYFDIFKVSRDDNPFGKTPVCKECIWDVRSNKEFPMCRLNRDGSYPYCFKWEDKSL